MDKLHSVMRINDILEDTGWSRDYFDKIIRPSKVFIKNVPNRTPTHRPSYLRSDFERYLKLPEW